ncbi:ribosome-associated protein [Nitrosomonas cryotolerans]|uniref:Dual-action ribosomal maturation protein DarP n=1 Tax=Nitrosomonas cryotolerans ATCC 49181 TaxID=1131553 RepID=A0A1N6FDH2_9PROT|nr:ribosome biogenesis factor YjgA [Nitrosomonas cryotolerans]SFQ00880.1 ribosome-associated protein [Nitrosomonas cryotolerans]SIN93343.1 ribosome-associated protein [Nitrosomonas cryotolerans ATCC 49181]
MQNNPENDHNEAAPPSKTQRKQAMHALQEMGEQLTALELKRLHELDLPEILMDAILAAKQIHQHGARRRQMQFIGKLMRKIDVTLIQEKLFAWQNTSLQQTTRLHQLERWRDRLLADDQSFTELAQNYPTADIQHLRLLVRNTHKEKLTNKPPKSFRLLFRELQAIMTETAIEKRPFKTD